MSDAPDPLSRAFAALADPTRRAILSMLLEDDMAVSDVAAPLPVSLAATSKHLRVLSAAGLIVQDRRGRITWCRIEPSGLRAACVWMRAFGQVAELDLDGFERFLAAEGLADSPPP
ncbi:MAG: ArsR/SmtB family transcription factor [Paracoccaceae bacterium]